MVYDQDDEAVFPIALQQALEKSQQALDDISTDMRYLVAMVVKLEKLAK